MQSIYLGRMQDQMALEVKETEAAASGGNPTSACSPVRTVYLMIQRKNVDIKLK